MVTSYILISRSSFSWLHITLLREWWLFSTNQLWSCAFGFCSYESWSWNSQSLDLTRWLEDL